MCRPVGGVCRGGLGLGGQVVTPLTIWQGHQEGPSEGGPVCREGWDKRGQTAEMHAPSAAPECPSNF